MSGNDMKWANVIASTLELPQPRVTYITTQRHWRGQGYWEHCTVQRRQPTWTASCTRIFKTNVFIMFNSTICHKKSETKHVKRIISTFSPSFPNRIWKLATFQSCTWAGKSRTTNFRIEIYTRADKIAVVGFSDNAPGAILSPLVSLTAPPEQHCLLCN